MDNRWKWMLVGAALVVAICTILPWYARNGASVSGFGGPALGNPATVALVCALLMVVAAFLKDKWRDYLLPLPIVVVFFLSAGNLWRAYKHGAVGIGLPFMLLAVLLAAYAAFQLARKAKN